MLLCENETPCTEMLRGKLVKVYIARAKKCFVENYTTTTVGITRRRDLSSIPTREELIINLCSLIAI